MIQKTQNYLFSKHQIIFSQNSLSINCEAWQHIVFA